MPPSFGIDVDNSLRGIGIQSRIVYRTRATPLTDGHKPVDCNRSGLMVTDSAFRTTGEVTSSLLRMGLWACIDYDNCIYPSTDL